MSYDDSRCDECGESLCVDELFECPSCGNVYCDACFEEIDHDCPDATDD